MRKNNESPDFIESLVQGVATLVVTSIFAYGLYLAIRASEEVEKIGLEPSPIEQKIDSISPGYQNEQVVIYNNTP